MKTKKIFKTFRHLAKMVDHAAHRDADDLEPEEEHDGIPDTRGNELAGTYVIASEFNTIVMASDGLRLARHTSPPLGIEKGHEVRGFVPLFGQADAEENKNLLDSFVWVLGTHDKTQRIETVHLSELAEQVNTANKEQVEADKAGIFTMSVAGVTIRTQHVQDFCHAAPTAIVTCEAVVNKNTAYYKENGTGQSMLKLTSGQLEELIMPVFIRNQ